MNAQEARFKSAQFNVLKFKKEHDIIMSAIKAAVNKGEFKAYYFNSLMPETESMLKKDGYRVHSNTDGRGETTVEIQW